MEGFWGRVLSEVGFFFWSGFLSWMDDKIVHVMYWVVLVVKRFFFQLYFIALCSEHLKTSRWWHLHMGLGRRQWNFFRRGAFFWWTVGELISATTTVSTWWWWCAACIIPTGHQSYGQTALLLAGTWKRRRLFWTYDGSLWQECKSSPCIVRLQSYRCNLRVLRGLTDATDTRSACLGDLD